MLINALLRFLHRLLYHQFAWAYDWVADLVSLGMWKSWVYSVIPDLRGPCLLEIGPGPGHLLRKLSELGMWVIAIERSDEMLGVCLRRGKFCNNFCVISGYAQLLPFSRESFNQIFTTFPSDYIRHPDAISSIFRSLKHRGEFIILPSAWITGSRWYHRLWIFLFGWATGIRKPGQDQLDAWLVNFSLPYQNAGFIVSSEIRQLTNSQVLIVRARKP